MASRVITAQREWEDLAHLDPLWAILTESEKKFGKWDRQEFFASGQREIDALMVSCGFNTGNNGRALDFGCGVGRLSKALLPYFGEVYGVNISEEMLRLAREYATVCTFLVNRADNLRLFQDNFFDFIYSNIVLQHQPTRETAKNYIREFIRIAKPGKMIVFQMPYRLTFRYTLQPRRRLYALLRTCGISADFLYKTMHLDPMRTICMPSREVVRTVSRSGGHVVRSYHDAFNRYSMSYVVVKCPGCDPPCYGRTNGK